VAVTTTAYACHAITAPAPSQRPHSRTCCLACNTRPAACLQNTDYSGGYSDSDPVIQRFWRVMAGFTNSQRCKWIQFCCGLKRIPPPPRPLRMRMKITKSGGNDGALPQSHSCFFSGEHSERASERPRAVVPACGPR